MSEPGSGRTPSELYDELRKADLGRLRVVAGEEWRRLRAYLAETTGPLDAEQARKSWLRPKGNLNRGELLLLLTLAIVPLLMVAVRITAAPGVLPPGLSQGLIPSLGHDLNQFLSLHQIPAGDRDRVLYLLFIPTGTVLIALARLTFGLRVIGFRAILIAMGFQASGTVPSLILICVMVVIVILVRPTLVRIKLPYYARVSVIMCLSVIVMLATIVLAPWLRSSAMWGIGFFPVIVLGLLAEGIAKTLDNGSGIVAVWRTGMTIGIALLLAVIAQVPALREVSLRFPELVLTQVVAVVLISEFLDLQLFQDLDARLSGVALPSLLAQEDRLRVAIVCNRKKAGIVGRLGTESKNGYKRRTLRRIREALRERGHAVKLIEGDISMLSKLDSFVPAHAQTREPGGLVLNLSQGIQGALPPTHVPAMLEMAGLAYTGPTPQGQLISHDKILMGTLLDRAGVPTPKKWVVRGPEDVPSDLALPVVVKPRQAHAYRLRVARERERLESMIRTVLRRDPGEVVLEQYLPGREIRAAVLGNHPLEILPLVEAGRGGAEAVCPAPLEAKLEEQIRAMVTAAFEACACRDYALVSVRLSLSGKPFVIEVEQVDVLEEGGAFELAAETAGLGFSGLLERILDAARARYQGRVLAPSLSLVSPEVPSDARAGSGSVAG